MPQNAQDYIMSWKPIWRKKNTESSLGEVNTGKKISSRCLPKRVAKLCCGTMRKNNNEKFFIIIIFLVPLLLLVHL
jgi:hypothetical protein